MSRQFICTNCGKAVASIDFGSESAIARYMRVDELCFDCAFWSDYLNNPKPHTAIISGKLYGFYDNAKPSIAIKFKQNKVVFVRNMQTGEVTSSRCYRYIAQVPHNFKDKLPDQYRFITKETFDIIKERIIPECVARGCWDRYHCFWYNKEKTEPNGPWNKIPDYHKPGDEGCESFINKHKIYKANLQNRENKKQ